MQNYYIVIMAGGSGTRLWPISRTNLPKQLHSFGNDKSLIQETYNRIKDLVPADHIYVSLVNSILKTSQKQLPEIPVENFIVEPEGKNTAPSIALIAATIYKCDPRGIVITLASDHVINKLNNFKEAVKHAFSFVAKNPAYFTTVGIKPDKPDTSLGYIKVGRKFEHSAVYRVDQFVEKPNIIKAKQYLKSGKYLWNASYFIWRADKLLEMYEKYSPEIYKATEKILNVLGKPGTQNKIDRIYREMPKEPIDTAIAEKVDDIAVVPADLGWSDIGSWSTLYDLLAQKSGNHTISQGNHIGVDDKNCLVYAQDKLLATVGLENIVIVDTPDVTLVCNKSKAQDIKKLIEKIKESKEEHHL
ncbi:MAG: sugar phosphate nucleotidyltransferase [Patescibacteria group bacterium]|jgi:mannose-1-phosphate guanylyltransferase